MYNKIGRSGLVAVVFTALALAWPVLAAQHMGPGGKGGGPEAQQFSGMMHDMSGEMTGMHKLMSHGKLGAAQQKQMAEQMRQMSQMMEMMSGMMGKGMMMDADMRNQFDGMRKQMDTMMKTSPAAPTTK